MDLETLNRMVDEDAALRRRRTLQPAGGKGDKIFPPTYPGEGRNALPQHVYEQRRINGNNLWCVLVDSVQSQANRLEECLLEAIDEGVPIPHVVVDFSGHALDGISRVTSLDAPHRVYDAILRDSKLGDEAFGKSEIGQRLTKARSDNAKALLEISPTALLFGAWHSTGEGGGLGAKFPRCLTSEITAINVPIEELAPNQRTGSVDVRTAARRTSSRIDPLGVLKNVTVFKGATGWYTTKAGAGKNAKEVKPSEINHGNIVPSIQPLGITCDHIEHTFVLSVAGLRRLRFGTAEKNAAGRSLLAALGLFALLEQDARGYSLRSRCDLVCDGEAPLEIVHPDGTTRPVSIDRTAARMLYRRAFDAAQTAGFVLSNEPIRLTPQDKLVAIVRKSQELALSGVGGEQDEGDADGSGSGD